MPDYTTAPELTGAYLDTVWETLPRHIRPTFFLPASGLSKRIGCELTIVSETFQYTGSFKFRGAYNLLSSVPQRRIVAASSGNFGQAVTYASQLLGKTATIVMPVSSARVKVLAVQGYGGIVDLIDTSRISRAQRVQQLLAEREGAFQAHAYDDYRVVAGNSTLGREIFGTAHYDILVVPVGGGGLCAGQIVARDRSNARTEIIGAEPQLANDAARSLRSGQLVHNEREPLTVADGARTLSMGKLNWEILRQGVADILEVPDPVILAALRVYFSLNLKVEPTGALALGAVLAHPIRFAGQRVCCIVSGGNVDPLVYAQALQEEQDDVTY
jgi:threonine dehydratase